MHGAVECSKVHVGVHAALHLGQALYCVYYVAVLVVEREVVFFLQYFEVIEIQPYTIPVALLIVVGDGLCGKNHIYGVAYHPYENGG